jgi:hypothetical protein
VGQCVRRRRRDSEEGDLPTAIRKSDTLQHALAHHAKQLEPLVGALALGILLELQPSGWELRQIKTGAQSFVLKKGAHEFHLRGEGRSGQGYTEIAIKDAWTHGREVDRLQTRADVVRFVRKLKSL